MADREDNVYMAKLAEQAERYDEMVNYMKSIASLDVDLTTEERNLLSVAYKNVIGARRASWRIITSIEQKERGKVKGEDNPKLSMIVENRRQIEQELNSICDEILKLLNDHLIPSATEDESKVFYHKMKGDYHRYVAELTKPDGSNNKISAKCSMDAYEEAKKIAEDTLGPTNPIRLGLALNYSVFFYEIKNDPQKACTLAKTAFDSAIADLDKLNEESYKDSTLIMQLLRDNLTLWTADHTAEDDKEESTQLQDVDQEEETT